MRPYRKKSFPFDDDVCSEAFIKPDAIEFNRNALLTLYT